MWRVESKSVISELRRLAKQSGGDLSPQEVVEAARPKSSPLHSRFEWDDSKAAHEHRLEQARRLLRVVVEYLPEDVKQKQPIRVFYSLPEDRRAEAGYRTRVDIVANEQKYAALLESARDDMLIFRRKYELLRELGGVMQAIDSALAETGRKRRAA